MKTMQREWEDFWSSVAPKDAPAVQRQEMRRAFYAGAWMLLTACASLVDEDISEDASVEQIEKWKAEIVEILLEDER